MTVKQNHEQLVRDLACPGEQLFERWSKEHCFASHMILGVMVEMLELSQALKSNPEMDCLEVIEELGDLEFFLAGLYQVYGYIEPLVPGTLKPSTYHELEAAGEVLGTEVKRLIYYNKLDAAVKAALHDFSYQLQRFYVMCELTRDEVLQANINKLRKRYGDKFTDKAAHERRDKNPVT